MKLPMLLNLLNKIRFNLTVLSRKLLLTIFNRRLNISKFEYSITNRKGLLILEYCSKGLIYVEVFNQKFLQEDNTLVFNLSNCEFIEENTLITFHGKSQKIIESISIMDDLKTDLTNFQTRLNLNLNNLISFNISNKEKLSTISCKQPKLDIKNKIF